MQQWSFLDMLYHEFTYGISSLFSFNENCITTEEL